MSGGILTQINTQPAPAVEGDFASANPRFSKLAGPGGFVAGLAGVTVGRFVWASYQTIDANGAPATANNFGSGAVAGFIHREQQGLIINYLTGSGMLIQPGFGVTVHSGGDFWVRNAGAAQALPGMKCYASFADGTASFAAAGAPAQAASVTGSVAASTFSVTGSVSNDIMTVTAVGSGTVVPGATISGTGISTGSKVVRQLTGTPGGVGTYVVSIPEQSAVSTTISGTYGTMTVTAVGSGTLGLGQNIAGTNVVAGTTITAFGTGTGGTGTYIVDNNTVVGSTTITSSSNVETSWHAESAGLTGELVKISNVPGIG